MAEKESDRMEAVLDIVGLKKTFRRGFRAEPVRALKGVSFRIEAGAITGFLGANGAGKTTSIKCILGLAFPDGGEIRYFGKAGLDAEAKRKIGFLPERPYFYEYLTGTEFLRFYGELSRASKGLDLRARAEELLRRVGLWQARDRQLRSYSKGMLQRVGIAQALIHRPEFVVLDEPMTGLDPDGRHEVREIIRETARDGTAVFFSSHQLPDAESICQRLVVLKQGELIYQGSLDGLLRRATSGFSIEYARDGSVAREAAATLAETQATIDRLRRERRDVLSVRAERMTLEEAFVRIGFDHGAAAAGGQRDGLNRDDLSPAIAGKGA
jgi:ABC-2 type transport system ATP-binding protein